MCVQDHVVYEAGRNEIEDERSLWYLVLLGEQSTEERVVGLAVVQPEEHGLLVVIHRIGIVDIDVV